VTDLLLLSGGIDSTAAAALLRPAGTLVIDYGQVTAPAEIAASASIASALDLPHAVLKADCRETGSGLLQGGHPDAAAPSEEWWPFRNQLLLTLAAAWALPKGHDRLLFATVRSDRYHRDGQPRFFELANELIAFQEGGIRAAAPLIDRTTAELCKEADLSPTILGWTFSCHRSTIACGDCPGCNKRRGVFADLGLR
jgi:7-cyano-7-deazaguanine synthase